jgi:outer membrane receptor protein involved in Fe transport
MAALAAASGAAAQTLEPAATAKQTAAATTTSVGELVVTGSRLPTTILNSPNPIVVMTSTQIEETGTDNLERAVTQLPSIDAGFTDTDSENFYAAAGLNLIDLRHLGYNRTLVLVNGRRQVPGDIGTGAVDLNSIPAQLVDRVDVVTGGLSAVYGADAVSGVVNIILKDHYQGFDVRARGGISRYGDGEQWGVGFLAGRNFLSDRANVTVSFDWDRSEGVPALARPWGRDVISVIPNDAATGPNSPAYLTVHNALFFGIDQRGFIAVAPYGPNDFYTPNSNGTAFTPYNYGDLSHQTVNDVLNNGVQIGGDGGYYRPFDNLSLPLQRFAASVNFTYDLAPHAEFFLESRVAESWVKDRWQPTADFENGEVFINSTNPYVPASFLPIIAASGQNGFYFGREYVDEGRRGADDDRFMQQHTAGFRGTVFDKFKWEAFAGWGQTDLTSNLVGGRDQVKFLQSVDVTLLNGQPACADPAARAEGCQPFNPFNPASTPAGGAYSRVTSIFTARNDLATAGADISGDLFNLWAGPVSASVGVEARRDSQSNSAGVCGIQLLCSAPYAGHINVGEVFGETRVPLLKDFPLVHDAYFQGAVRYSDYSTNHGHVSWNLGGVYSPIDGVNFRVMRSRSVRAPNVDELYATESQSFENLNDPCSILNLPLNPNRAKNCGALGIPPTFAQTTSSKSVYFGGNPALNVETADTWTGGVTLAPKWIPHLSVTFDYFSINLDGAIGAIDPQTLLDTCTDLPIAPGANPACAAITRDPNSHQISAVFANNQNLGRVYTAGYDFSLTYSPPLQDIWREAPGQLTLNVATTDLIRLRQYDNLADPSTQHQYEGYLGVPKWKVLGSATYALDKVSLTWRVTYLSSTSIFGSSLVAAPTPGNLFDLQTTGSKVYNDLSIAYRINRDTNLRLNVDNIFNVEPPQRSGINDGITYGGTPWATAGIYPNLGTMFSVVLDHKFW